MNIEQMKLIERTDIVFSKYIRLVYKNNNNECTCYTCGKKDNRKTMHNGHFVSRKYRPLRRSEDNCRVQCYKCNILKHGNYLIYTRKMISEIGIDKVDELMGSMKEENKILETLDDGIYQEYKQKVQLLLADDIILV